MHETAPRTVLNAIVRFLLVPRRAGVDGIAALRQMILHCGSHTPFTRDSILQLLLSFKDHHDNGTSAIAESLLAGPAWAHPNDLKSFSVAFIAVILCIWDIPVTKQLGVSSVHALSVLAVLRFRGMLWHHEHAFV